MASRLACACIAACSVWPWSFKRVLAACDKFRPKMVMHSDGVMAGLLPPSISFPVPDVFFACVWRQAFFLVVCVGDLV